MLAINWKTKGETAEQPTFFFGFDDAAELMQGKVNVGFVDEGRQFNLESSLAITGDFDVKQAVSLFEYRVLDKGSKEDGTYRKVYPFLNSPLLPFRAGLTVHGARGMWSSLPHEFEREEILTPKPMPFYEKFAYVTEPAGAWGIQTRIGHLYNPFTSPAWVNDAVVIRDRDILDIPLGSHPVTAGPETFLAYFWCYWSDSHDRNSMKRREKFNHVGETINIYNGVGGVTTTTTTGIMYDLTVAGAA
jgi:hypothetical protein